MSHFLLAKLLAEAFLADLSLATFPNRIENKDLTMDQFVNGTDSLNLAMAQWQVSSSGDFLANSKWRAAGSGEHFVLGELMNWPKQAEPSPIKILIRY